MKGNVKHTQTPSEQAKLIEPTLDLEGEYLAFLEEHRQAGEDFFDDELAYTNFAAYLHKLVEESQGIELPPGIVPATTYWLVKEGRRYYLVHRLLIHTGFCQTDLVASHFRPGHLALLPWHGGQIKLAKLPPTGLIGWL